MPLLPSNCNWLSIMPINLSQTRVFTGLCASKEARDAVTVDNAVFEAETLQGLIAINGEDMLGTVKLQQATRSRYIERGAMSSMEIGVLHYYRYLAGKLL